MEPIAYGVDSLTILCLGYVAQYALYAVLLLTSYLLAYLRHYIVATLCLHYAFFGVLARCVAVLLDFFAYSLRITFYL